MYLGSDAGITLTVIQANPNGNVGGLIGNVADECNVTLENVVLNHVTVIGEKTLNAVGGLIGMTAGNVIVQGATQINDLTITAKNAAVGGMIGTIQGVDSNNRPTLTINAEISNTSIRNNVTKLEGDKNVGGVVGYLEGNLKIQGNDELDMLLDKTQP